MRPSSAGLNRRMSGFAGHAGRSVHPTTHAIAPVLEGLSAGEVVVLFPSDQITTGRRVTPAR